MFNKGIAIALVVLLVLAGAGYLIYTKVKGGSIFPSSGTNQSVQKALDYIQNGLGAGTPELVSTSIESGVYKFHFKLNGQEYDSYVTKDGKILFVEGISIASQTNENNNNQNNNSTPEAQDKPDVKLFVMSYCPYGLQAEKMYLPVYNLLKDKASMGIYFVDYAMHEKKEVDENLRQYCIQKEQNDKYANYLSCFVKAGNSSSCLTQAGIDQTKLSSCVASADTQFNVTKDYNDKSSYVSGTYPKFEVNADLNTQYNIQGSPTIVINGKTVNVSPRSPEAFKTAICNAFTEKPSECSQTLSTTAATTSFDSENSATTGGNCQ